MKRAPGGALSGRPSLEAGAASGPCPVLLAVAEGRNDPILAAYPSFPMPYAVEDE
jgi:hypothetical protein